EGEIVVCWITSPIKTDAVHISAGFGVVISQNAGPDQAGFWRKTVFQSGVENVFLVVRPGSPGILLGTVEACQVKTEFSNGSPSAELVSGIAPLVAHYTHSHTGNGSWPMAEKIDRASDCFRTIDGGYGTFDHFHRADRKLVGFQQGIVIENSQGTDGDAV